MKENKRVRKTLVEREQVLIEKLENITAQKEIMLIKKALKNGRNYAEMKTEILQILNVNVPSVETSVVNQ